MISSYGPDACSQGPCKKRAFCRLPEESPVCPRRHVDFATISICNWAIPSPQKSSKMGCPNITPRHRYLINTPNTIILPTETNTPIQTALNKIKRGTQTPYFPRRSYMADNLRALPAAIRLYLSTPDLHANSVIQNTTARFAPKILFIACHASKHDEVLGASILLDLGFLELLYLNCAPINGNSKRSGEENYQ